MLKKIVDVSYEKLLSRFHEGKELNIVEYAQKHDLELKQILACIEQIREADPQLVIHQKGLVFWSEIPSLKHMNKILESLHQPLCTVVFGGVSDTHLVDKTEQLEHLQTTYDDFKAFEYTDEYNEKHHIGFVVHAGDINQGSEKMHRGMQYQLKVIGASLTKQYIVDNYPVRDGVRTKIISGNHDETHWLESGFDLVPEIVSARKDMDFLGKYEGGIIITAKDNPKAKFCVAVIHPGAKRHSKTVSYNVEQELENVRLKMHQQFDIIGHFHRSYTKAHDGRHSQQMPCYQGRYNFLKALRVADPHYIGGTIWVVRFNEEGIRSVQTISIDFEHEIMSREEKALRRLNYVK